MFSTIIVWWFFNFFFFFSFWWILTHTDRFDLRRFCSNKQEKLFRKNIRIRNFGKFFSPLSIFWPNWKKYMCVGGYFDCNGISSFFCFCFFYRKSYFCQITQKDSVFDFFHLKDVGCFFCLSGENRFASTKTKNHIELILSGFLFV